MDVSTFNPIAPCSNCTHYSGIHRENNLIRRIVLTAKNNRVCCNCLRCAAINAESIIEDKILNGSEKGA